jgi:hypothetical protein
LTLFFRKKVEIRHDEILASAGTATHPT